MMYAAGTRLLSISPAVCHSAALVAVTDLIRGFPCEEVAFIGFFYGDTRRQGKGVGSCIISDVTASLKVRALKGFTIIGENRYLLMDAGLCFSVCTRE